MLEKHYSDICKNIQVTDDISFKLLGFVPLISGSGILIAVIKSESLWSPAVYLVSLFGALVTFGLFRWELRNIQTCMWLRDRAADIEKADISSKAGQFYRRPKAPVLVKLIVGKTEAEKLIYSITIFAWLGLPWMVWSSANAKQRIPIPNIALAMSYIVLAVIIVTLTIISVKSPLKATIDNASVDDA